MKPTITVGAVAAALVSVGSPAAAQTVGHGELPPAATVQRMENARSNIVVVPSTASSWTNWSRGSAGCPIFKARPLRPPSPLLSPSVQGLVLSNRVPLSAVPAMVPPGVYETAPYSCVVVVPGPHPDDSSLINPGGGGYAMPIARPDLQFVPRGQAKK